MNKQKRLTSEVYFPRWALPVAKRWLEGSMGVGVECVVHEGLEETTRAEDVVSVEFFHKQGLKYSMSFLGNLLRMQINAYRTSSSYDGLAKGPEEMEGLRHFEGVLSSVGWKKTEKGEYITESLSHVPPLGVQTRPEGWDEDLVVFLCPSYDKPQEPALQELSRRFPAWTKWRDGHGSNLCQWVWGNCETNKKVHTVDWLEEYAKMGGEPGFKTPSGCGMCLTMAAFRSDDWSQTKATIDWFETKGVEWWVGSKNGVCVESLLLKKFECEEAMMKWIGIGQDLPDVESKFAMAQKWFAQKERARLMKKIGPSVSVKPSNGSVL